MHINKILTNYLYDKNNYVLWINNQVYIYGIENILEIKKDKVSVKINNDIFFIIGNNLKIIKSIDHELLLNGEIYEIKK